MNPSLDGAYARVTRAEQHMLEFQSLEEGHWLLHGEDVIVDFDATTDEPGVRLKDSAIVIPLDFAIIVGETIYNLRAALDYLVYELAWKDSGVEQPQTQFPITSNKSWFDRCVERNEQLRGLSVAHIGLIESLQPYNGCDWIGELGVISNQDKHRKLRGTCASVSGASHFIYKGKRGWEEEWNAPLTDVAVFWPPAAHKFSCSRVFETPGGQEVKVNLFLAMSIAFSDTSWPVMGQLQMLRAHVAETLDAFSGEF